MTARASDPPGVVFAGAGMVSELHERAIRLGGHLRLAGVVDADAEVAHRRAAAWGCKPYTDLDAALAEPATEAVLVLAPEAHHAALASASLRAGRPVLVEKPVADPDDIAELERLAGARGLVCMPAHNYAYQPEFQSLLRLVRGGELGRVRAAWITYVIRHSEAVASAYGGVLDEVMIHHAYLALALFGSPAAVYAGCMEPAWESHEPEDQAWMTWHYSGGLSVHHFATFAVDDHTSSPWLFAVKVLGEHGSASYNWHDSIFQRPLGTLPFAAPAYEDTYIHEHRAFAAAIAGDDGAVISDLSAAAEAARLLTLARQASEQGAAMHAGVSGAGR